MAKHADHESLLKQTKSKTRDHAIGCRDHRRCKSAASGPERICAAASLFICRSKSGKWQMPFMNAAGIPHGILTAQSLKQIRDHTLGVPMPFRFHLLSLLIMASPLIICFLTYRICSKLGAYGQTEQSAQAIREPHRANVIRRQQEPGATAIDFPTAPFNRPSSSNRAQERPRN
jgi:hypothetical protein